VNRSKVSDTPSRSSHRHAGHETGRRRILRILAAAPCLLITRPAVATPDELTAALRETFGDRKIQPGRVRFELPRLAENGNIVPALVSVDSPMTEQDYVRAIHIFSEKNPLPRILEMRLGPHNGRAAVSARIRMATTQQVLAVAEMSDGTLWSAAVDIDVTVSSCT
jgi:sulfur-oxidizing protein SoxY